ncbi:MAG TPA: ATP-dependent zinc metalloprotease FtsH [Pirellulales bacterium]|jgi:cell division protease FtsH|nr:ATP-dependent zinc metalloprotease FtsH [Pirellulales bacterium]
MENKTDNGRKSADKKPPEKKTPQVGTNVIGYLLALGIGALLIVMLLHGHSEAELPYLQLLQLIRKGNSERPDPSKPAAGAANVTASDASKPAEPPSVVVEEKNTKKTYRYYSLSELTVGPTEVTGKVYQVDESSGKGKESEAKQVEFRAARLGLEDDGGTLLKLLEDNDFTDVKCQSAPSRIRDYLPALMFLALIVLFVVIMMRRFGGAGSPMAFGRSRGKMYAQEDIGVTFDDVAGIDEAVDELREVVEFLRSPEKYQVLGGRIPKGVLLVGPPGTGKTLLAKAIAGEAGVPFFSLSGSDFVEMFVGVGAARVRDMFQQAEAKAPCIIFIDELDALGKTRGTSIVGGHDEREQTLNALLVEMDGFDSNNGVIVLAATNRPETLDPALLRPGRFDRHVLVDRPDVKGREKILDVHVQNVKLDSSVRLKEVAAITSGFVGADLANLVNESALLAARKGKNAVGMEEFNEGVERVTAGLEKKQRVMHEDEKQRVAYHESGHALVAYSLPNTDPVHKVSIIPRGLAALGYMMQRPEGDRYLMTQAELESRIQVLLAGTLAEELIFSDVSTGAQNDLERASEIARSMVMDYGMSRLGRINLRESGRSPFLGGSGEFPRERNYSEQTAREIDKEVQRITEEAIERVRVILQQRRPALVGLAKRLIENEVIDADELRQIIEENSPSPQIVPGTATGRKRPLPDTEVAAMEPVEELRRTEDG